MSKLEEAARAAQREYYREWRRKNPDKVREKNRRYWAKRARLAAERAEEAADNADENH